MKMYAMSLVGMQMNIGYMDKTTTFWYVNEELCLLGTEDAEGTVFGSILDRITHIIPARDHPVGLARGLLLFQGYNQILGTGTGTALTQSSSRALRTYVGKDYARGKCS